MIPSYSIPLLDRNITELRKEHYALKNYIEQGDMKAVQSLASLREKAQQMFNRIELHLSSESQGQCDIYLFSLSTVLQSILNGSKNVSKINEKSTTVPWKKQPTKLDKSQLYQKKDIKRGMKESGSSSIIISKQASFYQSKQNSRFNSNLHCNRSSLTSSKNRQNSDSKRASPLTSNRKSNRKSPFSRKKQSHFEKAQQDRKQQSSLAQTVRNQLEKCLFDEPQPQTQLTIKLTEEQYKQIIKLKNEYRR